MTEAIWLTVGLLLGYAMCFFARGDHHNHTKKSETQETTIKRSKPSLRSPLRTHKVQYDKYRSKDSGLYEPSKPVTKKDEIEIGR